MQEREIGKGGRRGTLQERERGKGGRRGVLQERERGKGGRRGTLQEREREGRRGVLIDEDGAAGPCVLRTANTGQILILYLQYHRPCHSTLPHS